MATVSGNVGFDRNGLTINGRRTFIFGGMFQYFRVPRCDWERRMKLAAAGGVNTLEVYIPWNYHEPAEGQFDFETGDRNIAEFIELAGGLGLWIYVRPGPYICNEWDFGGLPAWLLSCEDMHLRSSSSLFLEKVRPFLKALHERIVPYLITKGGPIILYQIENEFNLYKSSPDAEYLRWLRDRAIEDGIDVPITACVALNFPCRNSDPDWNVKCATGCIDGVLPSPNTYVGTGQEAIVTHFRAALDRLMFESGKPMKDLPVFVSETSASAPNMLRLLSAGIKGFSGFGYTSRSNVGYWNSQFIGRGGSVKFLSSVIDGSCIAYDGLPGRHFHSMQAVAGFVGTFQQELLGAESVRRGTDHFRVTNRKIGISENSNEPRIVYTLVNGDTQFIFLCNETDRPQSTKMTVRGGRMPRYGDLSIGAGSVLPVACNIDLAGWGVEGVAIEYASCMISSIEGDKEGVNIEMIRPPAGGCVEVSFRGMLRANVLRRSGSMKTCVKDGARIFACWPKRDGLLLSVDVGPKRVNLLSRSVRRMRKRRFAPMSAGQLKCADEVYPRGCGNVLKWDGEARPMEKIGITDGYAWYRVKFRLTGEQYDRSSKLVLTMPGDVLTVFLNGAYLGSFASGGRDVTVPEVFRRLKTGWNIAVVRCEIWGHACFDESFNPWYDTLARYPMGAMASLRGLTRGMKLVGSDCAFEIVGRWQAVKGLRGEIRGWHEGKFPGRCGRAKWPLKTKGNGEAKWYLCEIECDGETEGVSICISPKNCKGNVYWNGNLVFRFCDMPKSRFGFIGNASEFYVPGEMIRGRNRLVIFLEDVGVPGTFAAPKMCYRRATAISLPAGRQVW